VAKTPSPPSHDGEYFDRLVGTIGDFNPFTDRGWRTLARRFGAVTGGRSGLRLLDVGCGTGHSRRIYAGQVGSYTGIDLSLGSLRVAQGQFAGSWVQADAFRLPFVDGAFDVVAFSSVLHHLPERVPALREARRVLRDGGLVFAYDPNVRHPAMLLFRVPESPLYSPEGVSPTERPLAPRLLHREFGAAGLAQIGQRCQSDIGYRAAAPQTVGRLLPLFNKVDWLWEKTGIGRWLGTFVVTWGRRG
jgi:ubiquinone/menaquinone biosynthesis C-methylase UbiE